VQPTSKLFHYDPDEPLRLPTSRIENGNSQPEKPLFHYDENGPLRLVQETADDAKHRKSGAEIGKTPEIAIELSLKVRTFRWDS
jgi:hypothetical protein